MAPSRVHLQVRGEIAGPRVGFQAPAANKTLCQGTSTPQPLERETGSLWCCQGRHRGVGELGTMVLPLPHAVPLCLGEQTFPAHCSPIHPCPARFGHCSPSHCSFSRARIQACAGSMMLQAPLLLHGQWGGKTSSAPVTAAFSRPLPTHHATFSIQTCLVPKGSPTHCHLQTAKPCPLAKYRVFFFKASPFSSLFFQASASMQHYQSSAALENKVPRAPAGSSPVSCQTSSVCSCCLPHHHHLPV